MAIYLPEMVDKIVTTIAGLKANWQDYVAHKANSTDAHGIDAIADDLDAHKAASEADDVHGLAGKVIEESGSNTDGSYIKFADGTMFCRKSVSAVFNNSVRSADISWTFPVAFADVPFVSGSCYNAAAYSIKLGHYGGVTKTAATRMAFGDYASAVTRTNPAMLFAVGRWKA